MDRQQAEAAIEALLFAMGDSVPASDLAHALELDVKDVCRIIHHMMLKYEEQDRGIQIIELEDAFQMCTKPAFYEYLIRLTHQPRKHLLTDVMLETLSIVAYKQPVTRAEIEKIRGVNSDHALNRLIEYGLVCETGRLDAPGKPILFGTTEDFLRTFGVRSIDELPVLNPEKVEEFKTEAEEEAQMSLDV